MSVKVVDMVWKHSPYDEPSILAVMLALADWSDDDGRSFPKADQLAKKARQGIRNVGYILRRMKDDGFLSTTNNHGRGLIYQLDLVRLRDAKPQYTERKRTPSIPPPVQPLVASDNENYGISGIEQTLSDSVIAGLATLDASDPACPEADEVCKPCISDMQPIAEQVCNLLQSRSANGDGHIRKNRHGTVMEPSNRNHVESAIRPGGDSISDGVKSQVEEVFDYWREVMGHPLSKLSDKREKKIKLRLKEGFSVEELKFAIDGCRASPHHMGVNDQGTIYDDLELICRDTEHVEKFIQIRDRDSESVCRERGDEEFRRKEESIREYERAYNLGAGNDH